MENEIPFILPIRLSLDGETVKLFENAYETAESWSHEFITPEHLLLCFTNDPLFLNALEECGGNGDEIIEKIKDYLNLLDKVEGDLKIAPGPSMQFNQLVKIAETIAFSSGKTSVELAHVVKSLLNLNDSTASYIFNEAINGNQGEFLRAFISMEDIFDIDFGPRHDIIYDETNEKEDWKKLVVCINDIYKEHNPLIGREEELEKTMRVLCRMDKNNPLHIGDPGVGKTALIYGLARLIEEGKVPDRLQGSKIYRLDMGTLIAGTQFRGDFEKRIKLIMDGLEKEENPIVYIDEIHNLIGAGTTGEGSMDGSNMLKPYLESGKIRFIGATTYDEYKRYFAKSKGIVRRFTNIDILEPSVDEAINILRQLQGRYETFHNVKYTDDAIEFSVRGTAKYINDRFLPDKAIDLLDESGAMKQMEGKDSKEKVVDKRLISSVLARICKVDNFAMEDEDSRDLENLEKRILANLFGQDKAVGEVSESVLMSKAGLNDDTKPIASLLFVGPTGVGKTELAKLLARELGVELIRFDMSEYTEKHTVAKLIGSPAGYVGYEDGGLLTDAIRRTPNAVLLLDEIEKAHQDIYNILLQVMDYARLTDNKGNKADFRNVILIMTSNAGAQFASYANVGFAGSVTQGDVMMKHVKKIFKPEFLNRLSATIVFNDMSREMASRILDKKLNELIKLLKQKNVSMSLTEEAREFLLTKGFTKEYGARELDRVIHHYLKRLLMKEILFGSLKNGGFAKIELGEEELRI